MTGRIAARKALGVATHIQRLPAAIKLDHRGEYGARFARQRFQLREYRVGFGFLIKLLLHRIDPLPREPGHAMIAVLCRRGEFAQTVRRSDALRGRHARLRMLRGKRKLDQRLFSANAGDRDAAAFRIERAVCHCSADRIGAMIRLEQRPRAGAVPSVGKRTTQCPG